MSRTRKWVQGVAVVAYLTSLSGQIWAQSPKAPATAGHRHTTAHAPAPRALRHARLDVDLAFDCGKCVAFYAAEPSLQREYGKRLTIVNHYTAANTHDTAPLRLYLVARAAGKSERAAQLLMSEHLDTRSENEVLVLTAWSATQLGIRQAYDASFDHRSMGKNVERIVHATGKRVAPGPSVVLNRHTTLPSDAAEVSRALNVALEAPARESTQKVLPQ